MLIRFYLIILSFLCLGACTSKKEVAVYSEQASNVTVGNIEEGRKLYGSCVPCHGTSGEGNAKLHAPSIANVDGWYLYRQMLNFQRGIRGGSPNDSLGFRMASMSKVIKDSIELKCLIAYINTMPAVPLAAIINGDAAKGKRTYENICGSCHGPAASGNEKLNAPKLNGLDDWYIKRQIVSYKTGLRGSHQDDKFGAQMVAMMALLPNDQAVDDVIAYIRSTVEMATK